MIYQFDHREGPEGKTIISFIIEVNLLIYFTSSGIREKRISTIPNIRVSIKSRSSIIVLGDNTVEDTPKFGSAPRVRQDEIAGQNCPKIV